MPLRVIGAGLGRTGTASLKVALEQLGVGRCYHMSEVIKGPERIQDWIDAADGKPDWDKIYGDYGATVDYPGCTFWQELAAYYPEAKVLLTVRDPQSWFDSTRATIMSPEFRGFMRNSPFGTMTQKTIYDTLDNRMDDREFMVSYFERRNAGIVNAVPADRLLVYQVKEGWGPLCECLGVPVPDTEFPRINSREETAQMLAGLMSGGGEGPSDAALAVAGQQLHPESSE